MPRQVPVPRLAGVLCVLAAIALGGCKDFGDVTASIAGQESAAPPADTDHLHDYADHWGKIYAEKPGEKIASINYVWWSTQAS